MAKSVEIIHVFVAAPSDVKEERRVVSDVLSEWNIHHGAARGVMVETTGWRTHAHPGIGARPQQFINEQVLSSADIVIGILWSRFGTPTGVAESGTEEEIRRSIAAGKKVMLYFSDRPLPPSKVEGGQYRKLQAFRKEVQDQGLVWDYSSLDEFRSAFRRHVASALEELEHSEAQPTSETSNDSVAVSLSPRYWVVVLASLERLVQCALSRTDEMRETGIGVDILDEAERLAIAGPMIARAAIVDALVECGEMVPEASERIGSKMVKKLSELGLRWEREHRPEQANKAIDGDEKIARNARSSSRATATVRQRKENEP